MEDDLSIPPLGTTKDFAGVPSFGTSLIWLRQRKAFVQVGIDRKSWSVFKLAETDQEATNALVHGMHTKFMPPTENSKHYGLYYEVLRVLA